MNTILDLEKDKQEASYSETILLSARGTSYGLHGRSLILVNVSCNLLGHYLAGPVF